MAKPPPLSIETMQRLIAVAMKREEADLLLSGAQIIDVFAGKIERKDVAIVGEYIAAIGKDFQAKETIDLTGKFILPGFIDAHIHVESSMLSPVEFTKAVLPRGTTAVIWDPHEIANVGGVEAVEALIDAAEDLPLDFFFTAPSCVPSTGLETSGAALGLEELKRLLARDQVLALGEVMNYPAVLTGDRAILEKVFLALSMGKRVDGHAPGLMNEDVSAYCAPGITSDHECTNLMEAEEKLKRGMYIMIREGSTAKNMSSIVPLVRAYGVSRFTLVSDDRVPEDLLEEGHADFLLRKAVYLGMAPNLAVRMVTFNPAFYYDLKRRGAVAPGYLADIAVVDDINGFNVSMVVKRGEVVARDGEVVVPLRKETVLGFRDCCRVKLLPNPFRIDHKPGKEIRVISLMENEITTGEEHHIPLVERENVVSDTARDILKLAVVERHRGTGNVGIGFVEGLGLKRGALASSVAHDSHNIVVVGVTDAEMELAVRTVVDMGGGLVVVDGEEVVASLPLPIAGLLSDRPLSWVAQRCKEVDRAAAALGAKGGAPFMRLSFLALPVIPSLKLTDRGLVDVDKASFVELFVD